MVMGVPITEDSGVDNRSLFKAKRKYGVCTEQLFHSNPGTMGKKLTKIELTDALKRKDKWFYNIKTIAGMAKCLSMGYVPGLGIELFNAFMNIKSDGWVPIPSGDSIGSHDQPIVTISTITNSPPFRITCFALRTISSYGAVTFSRHAFRSPVSFSARSRCFRIKFVRL